MEREVAKMSHYDWSSVVVVWEWSSGVVEWSSGEVEWFSGGVEWSSGVVDCSSGVVECGSGSRFLSTKAVKGNPKSCKEVKHFA